MISPHVEFADATDDDVVRFYGPIEINGRMIAKAARKGKLVSAFGGLLELSEGEWLAFFEVPAYLRRPSLYRLIVRVFDEAERAGAKVIKASCDTRIEGAERLMRHLGFQPTEETANDLTVWVRTNG